MDAEPQVESLMQLLNDALNELDNLDTRLTGYDNLLKVSWSEQSHSKYARLKGLSLWKVSQTRFLKLPVTKQAWNLFWNQSLKKNRVCSDL